MEYESLIAALIPHWTVLKLVSLKTISNPIPDYTNIILLPLIGDRMIELGRKKTKIDNEWITYKSYFESIGYDHVSIDIQGGYDSLALDLRQPIEIDPADMVTNFGTTEHVSSQSPAWMNIHNFCKVDGVIISMCPYPGDWWWHGIHYPTEEFYIQFAERNGYSIEYLGIGRDYPYRNVDVRMKKEKDMKFTMPDNETIYRNHQRPR